VGAALAGARPARRARARLRFGLRLATLVVLASAFFSPLYWLLKSSFEPEQLIRVSELRLGLGQPTLASYQAVLAHEQFRLWFRNSVVVAAGTMAVAVVVSTLAAYSLARLPTRLTGLLSRLFFLAYIVPSVMVFIPLFIVIASLGLQDTHLGLIITYTSFAVPFGVWMLRAYFATLPVELEDAALVDGCSRLGALVRIVIPLAAPGIVTVALFAFILAWNDVLFAMIFTRHDDTRTLGAGLQQFTAGVSANETIPGAIGMSATFAMCVLTALPIVVVFVVLQRWLVRGLAAGSVKG
jgi:ABC-type glycerol-3-phosphate transport system permease component